MNNKTIWVVIIIIILVIGGWLVVANKPATNTDVTGTQTASTTLANSVYTSGNDAAKGVYMTDLTGMALYTFDNDSVGTTTCYGGCATAWPPYLTTATVDTSVPADISVITRADGAKQFTYKGLPLYYYQKDTAAGQINGDGVGGIWHIIKL